MTLWSNKEKPQQITYEINASTLVMPKDDECIVLQFPKNTPKEVMQEFDKRLAEFQNGWISFIAVTVPIKFIKTKKGLVQIEKKPKPQEKPKK